MINFKLSLLQLLLTSHLDSPVSIFSPKSPVLGKICTLHTYMPSGPKRAGRPTLNCLTPRAWLGQLQCLWFWVWPPASRSHIDRTLVLTVGLSGKRQLLAVVVWEWIWERDGWGDCERDRVRQVGTGMSCIALSSGHDLTPSRPEVYIANCLVRATGLDRLGWYLEKYLHPASHPARSRRGAYYTCLSAWL